MSENLSMFIEPLIHIYVTFGDKYLIKEVIKLLDKKHIGSLVALTAGIYSFMFSELQHVGVFCWVLLDL